MPDDKSLMRRALNRLHFWIQGVRPTSWWEEKRAQKATKISSAVCARLLVLLALAIVLSQRIKDALCLNFS